MSELLITGFQVYERGTGKCMGKPLKKRTSAIRKVVRLDNAYGCYHYYYLPVYKG